jgi:hypothetical protein
MAHYALLDENNCVVQVIAGRNEDEVVNGISDWEDFYTKETGLTAKRTSYNNNIRTRYAGIGMFYNEERDAFIYPQPYPSWTLNDSNLWAAPVTMPIEVGKNLPIWNEDEQRWETQ